MAAAREIKNLIDMIESFLLRLKRDYAAELADKKWILFAVNKKVRGGVAVWTTDGWNYSDEGITRLDKRDFVYFSSSEHVESVAVYIKHPGHEYAAPIGCTYPPPEGEGDATPTHT